MSYGVEGRGITSRTLHLDFKREEQRVCERRRRGEAAVAAATVGERWGFVRAGLVAEGAVVVGLARAGRCGTRCSAAP